MSHRASTEKTKMVNITIQVNSEGVQSVSANYEGNHFEAARFMEKLTVPLHFLNDVARDPHAVREAVPSKKS